VVDTGITRYPPVTEALLVEGSKQALSVMHGTNVVLVSWAHFINKFLSPKNYATSGQVLIQGCSPAYRDM